MNKKFVVREVTEEEYRKRTTNLKIVFHKSAFSQLNAGKMYAVHYLLLMKESSPRFGVTFGEDQDKNLYCPFSAPFGFIESLKRELSIDNYYSGMEALEEWISSNGYQNVSFTLPPAFYDTSDISAWFNCMMSRGWSIDYVELNYALHIPDLKDDYQEKIQYNAKKNLKIALKSNLNFRECKTVEEQRAAYDIIRINRSAKKHPLRMTKKQVEKTMEIIPGKWFVAQHEEKGIAAALVFEVTDKIALIVYWGDIPGISELKVMNYMAYQLLKIYSDRGFEYLDIGYSTEQGEPNFGLCDFKDSIGCERSAKPSVSKRFCQGISG